MKTNITSALHRFKTRLLAWAIPAALCITMAQAQQTLLLDPAGDGGFENGTTLAANGWTAVATSTNFDNWNVGQGLTTTIPGFAFPSSSRCAYISDTVTAAYWRYGTTNASGQIPHMYRTITVPAGQTDVTISFQYTQLGASNTKLMVYVCDASNTPTKTEPTSNGGGISATGWGSGANLLIFSAATPLTPGTKTFSAPIPASFLNNCSSSKTFKLVFTSFRNSTSGINPPPAVDSIQVISRTPVSAASAVFTINNSLATGGTNFKSFTEAINWVNATSNCGLPNGVTFNVSAGQTFDENTPYITASGTAAKQIIFQKSGAGANPVIRPTGEFGAFWPTTSNPGTQDYGICLHGADYITFDGIDIISNDKAPSYTLESIAVEYGYLIRTASPTNGATNNTIKNTTILLNRNSAIFNSSTVTPATRGIVQSATTSVGGGFTANTALGTNDNNSYYNFTIGNVHQGIILYGAAATLPDRNTKIGTLVPGTFNMIGRTGVADDIGGNVAFPVLGINLNHQYDAIVSNNIIQNLTSSGTNTGTSFVDGIVIGSITGVFNGSGGFNNEVSNNRVLFLKSTAPSAALNVTGIRIQHDNAGTLGSILGFKVYNNAISNLTSGYTGVSTSARAIKGLWLQAGVTTSGAAVQYEIVNNSIVIDGSSSPNLSSIAFENAYQSSILKLRNNLFFNKTGAQTGSAAHYVLGITGATTVIGTSGSLSNYNDFYYSNPTGGYLSYNNNITSLSGWQSTFAVDANSISLDPKLNSSTVLTPLNPSPLTNASPTLSPPYHKDITGLTRAVGNSTIGAYEKVGDILSPVISDTSFVGVNSTASRSFPGSLHVVDFDGQVATTPGTAPRIYFKKSTEANAFGANLPSFNGWKWVEATNTTSPFDMAINYALLTSAVNFGDVIQYFFVAQDSVVTPNVSASPSAGFSATSVGAITLAPTSPKSYVIYNTPAAYVSSTSAQPITSGAIVGTNNNAIIRVALQTGPTGDSAYVNEMSFNSSLPTDLNNISGAKVWYTGLNTNFDINNPATKQFGVTYVAPSGSGALGTTTFTGAQIVPPNATVYFWLSFDLRAGATVGNQLDADVISLMYNGATQTPTVTSPADYRKVKQSYCNPAPTTSNRHISVVAFNTLNNNTGTANFLGPFYMNYAPVGTATTSVKRGLTYNMSLTPFTASTSMIAFIDYNDNGIFEAGETINVSSLAPPVGVATTVPVTIPCDAVVSPEVRMRVISYFTGSPWANNFCTGANGEVQDYTITIENNNVDYVSSSAVQTNGSVFPLATNKLMMKLPIVAQGCGTGFLTEVRCHIGKTMNPGGNILSAKLYSTDKSSSFTSTELLASVASPSGAFTFSGFSDSLYSLKGDTNYYWITYDISASATLNDTIDIRLDSITATNRVVMPGNNNPAEYLLVKAANTYSSSDVIHPASARAPRVGQLYTPVLRIRIAGTTTGAPRQLTQLNFDPAGGGNDLLNIASARVFYTGNTNTFTPVNQFGNTYTAGTNVTGNKWNTFSISGIQDLDFDTNYFWLAYDMTSNASTVDSVDGDLVSFDIGATTLTPTTKTVTGALPIKTNYCFMGPSGGGPTSSTSFPAAWYEDITNVTFGSINNSSTCAQTGGVGSILGQYSDYSDIVAPANVVIGDTVRFTLTGVSNCNQTYTTQPNMSFVILIDWNQNGVFDQPGEVAYRSASNTTTRSYTDKLFVPCSALPGATRMRVIFGTGSNQANALLLGTTCGNASPTIYLAGETEDYTLNVQSNPVSTISTSFVQQTGAIGAGVADIPVLRIAVKPKGCGANLNAMYFSHTGTNLANITAAKLYTTGTSNVFNNSTLLSSTAPAANIQFTGLNAAFLNNNLTDSTYFWLAYDIAPGAVVANTIDGKLDSLSIGANNYSTLATGNPAGSRAIAARMAFGSVTVVQPDTASVATGTFNKQILRIKVSATNTNGPVPITSLSFNVNGSGNNLLNVDSARVYYTTTTTFATTTPFGSAYSAAPGTWSSFTINGNVSTSVQDNYFWLVYDIKSSATIFDSVDAELTSVTFDGIPQAYTGGASSGNSKIRSSYCTPTSPGTNSLYYRLTDVNIGGTANTSTGAVPYYVDYTTLNARNVSTGVNSMSVRTLDFASPGLGGYTYVYIDYDQNGDFTGPNEFVTSVATPNSPANTATVTTFSYLIPCDVKTGITRMRVMASLSNTPPPLCALGSALGETEDYPINIQKSVLTYSMSAATQNSGSVIQGGNNQLIMNIKVRATGCGTAFLNNMYFNTVGSTNPATDIVAAKLYKTGKSNIFNTANLLGTVVGPNGQFNFLSSSINDSLVSGNDTSYYWLTYDINPSAVNNNIVDVRVDSIYVMGSHRIPSTNNPAQSKTVLAPLSILDITATQPGDDRVAQASNNFQALCIRVVANSSGATLPVTSLNFTTGVGGNEVSNLAAARVYYTGSNKTFSATNQFGATYTAGSNISGINWLPFTINGYQELMPDTNYFWLTYNINANAILGDSVDAEIPSLVINGVTQTLAVPNPAGNSRIRQEYCFPTGGSAASCVDTARIGTLNNYTVGQCAIYTNYPKSSKTTSAYAGSSLPVTLIFSAPTRASVFIDLNRNGSFEVSEEFNIAPSFVPSISTSIAIPANATLGETRLRVRTFFGQSTGGTDRACSNWNQSEIEDYTITILPALPQATYTWNNGGTSDFTVPSNWTPARNAPTSTDILVFNAPGSTLNITNMFSQTVASLEVATRTKVNLSALSPSTLQVTGALTLNDSSQLNGNANMMVEIGEGIGNPGILTTGNESGINSTIKRWVNTVNSSNLLFPFISSKGTRSMTMGFSFAPLSYGTIVASFVPSKALGNFGFPLYESGIAANVTKTCAEGYWNIGTANGLSGGVFNASFSMDSVSYLPNPYSSTIVSRTDAFSPWILDGSFGGASLNNTVSILSRTTIANYGQFTIAADSTTNPLPVTLVSFTAKGNGNDVQLQWNTRSEVNNSGFDLERSVDGKSFEAVTFVKGQGTSSVAHNYAYNDENAFAQGNVLYYRLKQLDMDGKFTYAPVVKVSSNMQKASAVNVFPNPFTAAYSVSFTAQNDATVTMTMTDIQGRTVATETTLAHKGNNTLTLNNIAALQAGVYFLKVNVDGETQVIKLIKN